MNKNSKIYIAGHNGMVGSALMKKLRNKGYNNLVYQTHKELDLKDYSEVMGFFYAIKPDYVFLAAAKIGGIMANKTYPADFIFENIEIQNNIISGCDNIEVKKLLFLGSSCIYPKHCPQPIKEDYLLSGYLEPTNESYAIAKIAGIKTCQAFNKQYETNYISVMPCNLFGQKDNFNLETSHLMPALIRKFHEAKVNNSNSVTVWGTGSPYREFLFVDDLADACLFLMNNYNDSEIINIGTGKEIQIMKLAVMIKEIVGYTGNIHFDTDKPDGTKRKLLDVSKINKFGWNAETSLREGIKKTYEWYKNNYKDNQ